MLVAASLLGSVWLGAQIAVPAAIEFWRGEASKAWPTVLATIEHTETQFINAFRPRYSPQIIYSFVINGKNFHGNRVDFRAMGYTREEADAMVARFRSQATALVHHQPDDPAVSTLISGPHWPSLLLATVGLFFITIPLVIAGHLLWRSLGSRRVHKAMPSDA